MSARICIPTAGTGSRLEQLTTYLNKSLVSLSYRPILSHLIEQCPNDAEFVIALGHKGHLVRQFLELAYPDRTFFFANVEPYEGPDSGLGLSLLQCRAYLQQPFIFMSCDTLVREPLPAIDHNWIGYAERDDLDAYRTVFIENDNVRAICEKGEGSAPTHKAYIGLASILDYDAFWKAMDDGGINSIQSGEAFGLRSLLAQGIKAYDFTWFDTGNLAALDLARTVYQEAGTPNILPKNNEAIWFVNNQVIKFSDDITFIKNRALRASEINDFIPTLTGVKANMYSYAKVEGAVLSEIINLPLFQRFLEYCTVFWQKTALSEEAHTHFNEQCMKFYKDKTYERVALYYHNFQKQDGTETINGVPMPTLASLLSEIDWDNLADGLPGRFHGDFHFENIIWSPERETFTFLDWRQDFGGSLTTGDIYYDLAKLLHGMIISHPLIAQDLYQINWHNDAIDYDFHRKQTLVECEQYFISWLTKQGYDVDKVKILTAVIYLNIAALHHSPYCHLLYALGKSMIYSSLNKQ
jgi:NDP-sugar pyrophosphorylase family protein